MYLYSFKIYQFLEEFYIINIIYYVLILYTLYI
jgi:hypothetical protein